MINKSDFEGIPNSLVPYPFGNHILIYINFINYSQRWFTEKNKNHTHLHISNHLSLFSFQFFSTPSVCATFQIASACCAFGLFWRTWHRPWRSANRSFNSPRSRWWHDSSSCFTTTLLPGEKIHKFGSHRFSSCTNLICFQKNQEGMKSNTPGIVFVSSSPSKTIS